jgi:hypothetical protein
MNTLSSPRPRVKSARKFHAATRPAMGGVRWALQPTDTHPGCLVVTTTDSRTGKPVVTSYLVRVVVEYGRVLGYQLEKANGTVYDLAADLSSCDCPDATFQPDRPEGGCKHRKSLAAALKGLVL